MLESGKAVEQPIVDDGDQVVVQPQYPESGKAGEQPIVDDDDLVVVQKQYPESGKAGERPIVDDGDQVVVQVPVKARYEQACDTRMMRWDGV